MCPSDAIISLRLCLWCPLTQLLLNQISTLSNFLWCRYQYVKKSIITCRRMQHKKREDKVLVRLFKLEEPQFVLIDSLKLRWDEAVNHANFSELLWLFQHLAKPRSHKKSVIPYLAKRRSLTCYWVPQFLPLVFDNCRVQIWLQREINVLT